MSRMFPFVVLFTGLSWASPAAAGDHQAQAEQLAVLRAEVEALSEQLAAEKDEAKGRLRAVEAQRVELDVQIRRQELRMDRLLAEEQTARAAVDAAGGGDVGVQAAVLEGIAGLRGVIEAGIPFKTDLRMAVLSELEDKLRSGVLSAEQAAARLWAFAEDERRLARENALDRQVVHLGGEDVLVEVARVGMVALYWRAPDGRVGRAVSAPEGWEYRPVDGADAENVGALFDALGKGIRSGLFTLPGLTAEVR